MRVEKFAVLIPEMAIKLEVRTETEKNENLKISKTLSWLQEAFHGNAA